MTERDRFADPLEMPVDPAWHLATEGYDPLRESSTESRFTVSNGFLGVRGGRAVTPGARWIVPPRTYVAGLFDTPPAEQAIPVLFRPRAGFRSASPAPASPWSTILSMCRPIA